MRLSRRQWVYGGAAVAAALTAALTLQFATRPECAAAMSGPAAAARGTGKATFYELGSGGGNCSFPGAPADDLYVALGPDEYDSAAACGGYLDVTGPRGTVRVKVVDQCPECERGHLDLSRTAFAQIAEPVQGIVKVTYRDVPNPRAAGRLSFRIKEGASQFWFAVLVLDHGNPLRSVEVRRGGAWVPVQRTDFNYWIGESGVGPGPFTVRVTDTRGQRVTARGIRLEPGKVQRSSARMYGGSSAGREAASADRGTARSRKAEKPPARRSPSPSPTVTAIPREAPAVTSSPAVLSAAGSRVNGTAVSAASDAERC